MIMTRDAYKITRLKINHNASKQEFQEQKAPEDFRKIEWYFEHFCEILESTGDERILGKCENYPQGYSGDKEQQGSKLKGFSEQQREFRGIL